MTEYEWNTEPLKRRSGIVGLVLILGAATGAVLASMAMNEDEEINAHLKRIQPQYPSLSLEDLRRLFDEVYDDCVRKYEGDDILDAEVISND